MAVYIASGSAGVHHDMSHPRLCFHKWDGDYTASNSAPGADAEWLGDGETWSVWKSGAGSVTVTLTYPEARAITYAGIAAHTLDLAGAEVTLQADTGSGFASVPGLIDVQINDDGAVLFLLPPMEVNALRLVVAASEPVQMAVFQAGLAMEMPRLSQFVGLPITESERIEYRQARTVRGNIVGSSVRSVGLEFQLEVQHLSEDFRRASGVNSWGAFKDHCKAARGFFVAPKPLAYPEGVAYAQALDHPRINRAIPNRQVSGEMTLSCRGHKRP